MTKTILSGLTCETNEASRQSRVLSGRNRGTDDRKIRHRLVAGKNSACVQQAHVPTSFKSNLADRKSEIVRQK